MKFYYLCQKKETIRGCLGKSVQLEIRESAQLRTVLELYHMEIHQKMSVPNHQKLKTMVKRSVDQKLRLRNFHARHGKIERGAVANGLSGVEGGKGLVISGKKEANVRRKPVQFTA